MEMLLKIIVFYLFVFTINLPSQTDSVNENHIEENYLLLFDKLTKGITFNYKGDLFSGFSKNIKNKNTYIDNFELILNLDLKDITGWNGLKLKASLLRIHGIDPNEFVCTAQGISNIAATPSLKLYELWLEQNLLNDNLSILVGLYDLNTEYDTRQTSAIFINPSQGIGAEYSHTGINGPSIFPNTSFGLRVRYNINSTFNIKTAIMDAIPGNILNKNDGFLISTELNYESSSEKFNAGYYSYVIGGWYYSSSFKKYLDTEIDGNCIFQKGNYGIYLSAEEFIFGERENSTKGLAVFGRLGLANRNVNMIEGYFGAGLIYTGLISGRDDDIIGLAIASIHNSNKYVAQMSYENIKVHEYENITELTYLFYLSKWLKIQPDIQYVLNPTFSTNDYFFVYGVRFDLTL
jgi:porin